ncbi:MAG: histidine--tRNA ligase, partial [Alphaproteobacteria bacterium]|nr:histidine--tRNA ligase [Alphaproteobacteria bacterium]
RAAYRDALVSYYAARRAELSEDSQRRLDANPLRILDSKDPADIRLNVDAPNFHDFMNLKSRDFFLDVRAGLDGLGIKYEVNPRLVRGLDYYTHTVFEFVTTDLGAQGTVLAGGRYDGLVELMGGPPMHGVGWAAGIERLALLIPEPQKPARPVAVIPVALVNEFPAVSEAEKLRNAGLAVELIYSGNMSRRLHRANRLGARFAVLLGESELERGEATVRDLDSGAQEAVSLGDLAERLKEMQSP